ncbi:hypothetical protein AX17_006626 [Amanita inopinata Kibby_2008]|nr:hypothetical protein AX17_006626 [Amanita inopinata Kibby_2008]
MHLFEKKEFDKLPLHREWDHEINLMNDALKDLPAKKRDYGLERYGHRNHHMQHHVSSYQRKMDRNILYKTTGR